MSSLPSLLYELDTPELEGIYSVQPVLYPDGNYYLKIGCNLPEDIYFENDLEEVQQWFRAGDSKSNEKKILGALQAIMPGLKIESYTSKRCILPRTKGRTNPYIGQIEDRFYVTAGNGYSAMCSDGVGYLMANLIRNGKLPEGFNPEDYEPILE